MSACRQANTQVKWAIFRAATPISHCIFAAILLIFLLQPRGINSVGRVSPSQGESREFEPRIPLHVVAAFAAAFFYFIPTYIYG